MVKRQREVSLGKMFVKGGWDADESGWRGARVECAIMDQMVVWEDGGRKLDFENVEDTDDKWGMVLPQVIPMGTVTHCAIEKTWVISFQREKGPHRVRTESNGLCTTLHDHRCQCKFGRGVDLGLGDVQFGMHNATASGWMTLEGTKSSGREAQDACVGMRRDLHLEQGVPPERIRIGSYIFKNHLGRPILGCGLLPHADRIDGLPHQAVPYPSAVSHLGASRIAVPRQRGRRVLLRRAGIADSNLWTGAMLAYMVGMGGLPAALRFLRWWMWISG